MVSRTLSKLLRDKELGELVVPIVPDEARTFGMEPLFNQFGIYSHFGQLYEPVDMDTLLYYKEASDGQILEEGITEAGSMASFIAAGTAYATHGVNTIPFFIYYRCSGSSAIGDLIWAAAIPAPGFLLGGTAGRTTLAGEGLQHQDGHSHCSRCRSRTASPTTRRSPTRSPSIVQDGIRRMYVKESIFYYLTVMNEHTRCRRCPRARSEGILEGHLPVKAASKSGRSCARSCSAAARSFHEVFKAQEILETSTTCRPTSGASRATPTLSRRTRRRALEHAPPGSRRACLRDAVPGGRARRLHRSVRLRAGDARHDRSLAARPIVALAPTASAAARRAALREFFEVDCRRGRRDAVAPRATARSPRRSSKRRSRRTTSIRRNRTRVWSTAPALERVLMPDSTLPELGENISAGDVLRVLVEAGDALDQD